MGVVGETGVEPVRVSRAEFTAYSTKKLFKRAAVPLEAFIFFLRFGMLNIFPKYAQTKTSAILTDGRGRESYSLQKPMVKNRNVGETHQRFTTPMG